MKTDHQPQPPNFKCFKGGLCFLFLSFPVQSVVILKCTRHAEMCLHVMCNNTMRV